MLFERAVTAAARLRAPLLAASLAAFSALNGVAQTFPSKPIKLVVPNPPGGATDIVARQLSIALAAELGQPVVIENRGGASGMVGAKFASTAPPDGYTLFLATTSVMSINPVSFARIGYDPIGGFAPITLLTTQPLSFVVQASSPYKTLGDLVAQAKAAPGRLNYANTGASGALPFLYLQHLAGMKIEGIPYAGAGPGTNALLGGQVDLLPISLGSIYPHIEAGKVRALAVTSLQRSPLTPDVPTVAELGYAGYNAAIWNGLAAPAGTPRDIIARLNRATVKVISTPEMKAYFAKDGTQLAGSTPEAFGDLIRNELERWTKVAKDAGLKPLEQ